MSSVAILVQDHFCLRRFLEITYMIRAAKLEIIVHLGAVIYIAVVECDIPGKVKEFSVIGLSKMGPEVSLILVVVSALNSKTCVHIGDEELTIKRLEGNE